MRGEKRGLAVLDAVRSDFVSHFATNFKAFAHHMAKHDQDQRKIARSLGMSWAFLEGVWGDQEAVSVVVKAGFIEAQCRLIEALHTPTQGILSDVEKPFRLFVDAHKSQSQSIKDRCLVFDRFEFLYSLFLNDDRCWSICIYLIFVGLILGI